MYKVLPIGGKEYKLEYTIEAALYENCVSELMEFFAKSLGAADSPDKEESQEEKTKRAIKNGISGFSNIPCLTVTILYAGLIEHHGTGRNGDKTVLNRNDAKEIIREYFEDHAEDGKDTFYDVFQICIEQMSEDGFFKRIGLEKMMSQAEKPNRAARRAKTKTSEK